MALLNGELAPGERLLTAQLSERFHVSPTPLREALHRFAGEGLVEFIPQRGARVAELSTAESGELTELRTLLEPACVVHAIGNSSGEWATELKATSGRLQSTLSARRFVVAESEHAYRAFYAALTSTCESARLRRYASSVRDQHARYRTAALGVIDRRGLGRLIDALTQSAVKGKAEAARKAVLADIDTFAAAFSEVAAT